MFKRLLLLILICAIIFMWEIGIFSDIKSIEEATGLSKVSSKISYYSKSELEKGNQGLSQKNFPDIFWLGHNGFYIKWGDKKILFDPNLSPYCKIIPRKTSVPIEPYQLGEIDIILISHAHFDHLDMPTLKGIVKIKNLVVPTAISTYLEPEIIQNSRIHELSEGSQGYIDEIKIISVYAKHNGSRFHPFSSTHRATGYILEYKNVRLYLVGDTGYGDFFKSIKSTYNPDISIVPIGSYEPYFILRNYHLSPEDAVKVGKDLDNSYIIPSHFGTFRLAMDRTDKALPKFIKLANEANIKWGLAKEIKLD